MSRPIQQVERRSSELHPLGSVELRIASSHWELTEACRLVYRAYLRQGLIEENLYELRVTPYHVLDTSEVLIAVVDGEVTSTALLVGDGTLGLPLESTYAVEVERLRLQGQRVGEASCLADRRTDFRWAFPVLVRVMSLTVQCAAARAIDQLLIAVHPRHGKFYQRYLGFQPLGPERSYAAVRGKPAVALSLDLHRLAETHARGYQTLFGDPFPSSTLQYRSMDEQWRSEMQRLVASASEAPALASSASRD